jgi:hypothetical protein
VDGGEQLAATGAASPQKILQASGGGPALHKAAGSNHAVMIGNDEQMVPAGSSMSISSAANGMAQVLKNVIFWVWIMMSITCSFLIPISYLMVGTLMMQVW